MFDFKGKTALITGGAGGIGRSTCEQFKNLGATVFALDLNEPGSPLPDGVQFISADAADLPSMEAAINDIVSQTGQIDFAMLNAGIVGDVAPIHEYSLEVFDKVQRVNVRGVWVGLKAILPAMLPRKQGSIILTSSLSGLMGVAGVSAYTTSKHAVLGILRSVSKETAAAGVRINAIAPGYVDTQMVQTLAERVAPEDPEGYKGGAVELTPMNRMAHPDEIASIVAFLASDASSYCTGGVYSVDGGFAT